MEPCYQVKEDKARHHEERRRRLLDTPWGTRLDSATPISERERSARPYVTYTLDHLCSTAPSLEDLLSPFSPISSITWTGLGSDIQTISASKQEEYPILDCLLQTLWNDQNATPQDLKQLENFVSTHSDIEQLLLRGRQSTSSPFSKIRATGYSLLEFICKHHYPLSKIQRYYVWISIQSFGSEKEELPRRLQMKALATLLGPRGDIVGLGDALTRILSWMRATTSNLGTSDLTTLTECHDILKCIIAYSIDLVEEDQIHEVIGSYCDLVSRSVQSTTAPRTLSFLIEIIELVLDQDLIPEPAIETLVRTLCLVLGRGGETAPSVFGRLSRSVEGALDEAYQCAAQAILGLLADGLYRLPVLETLESILGNSEDHQLSVRIGAVNAVCERAWSWLVAYFEDGSRDVVESEQHDALVSSTDEMTMLREIPEKWLQQQGSDSLFTCVIKFARQLVHSFDFETSPCMRGFLSMAMSWIATLVTKFSHPDGSSYLLVISQQPEYASPSSSPLLNEIEILLANFFGVPHFPPYLVHSFLSMSRYLRDHDLLAVINASRKQLSPVHDDWARHFRLSMDIFYGTAGRSHSCRRALISSVEKVHQLVVDVAPFHDEIHEKVVLLGKILMDEHDEEILHSIFRILSRELVATITGEQPDQRHLRLNGICNGWVDLANSECKCRPRDRSSISADSPIINPVSSTPESSDCWRHILAVKFLINAFNKMAFTNTGIGSVNPTESTPQQPPCSLQFCLQLFQKLLESISPTNVRAESPHICVKARIAILQWMLRIRADSKHRVYIVVGDIPEVAPLAQMAQRADISTAPFWMHNDVDFALQSRIQVRKKRSNSGPINTLRRQRPRSIIGTVGDVLTMSYTEAPDDDCDYQIRRNRSDSGQTNTFRRKRPRSIGAVGDVLTMSSTEAPAEDCDYQVRVENPDRFSWYIPDVLMVDFTKEMKRPSRVISTPTRTGGYGQCDALPVHLYLSAITAIITHSRDWEIVSYVLCHLPIQLSNKRAFYGPDTNKSMRRLVVAICASINGYALSNRVRNLNPSDLPASAVQAILYHSLTALLGYHKWLQPFELEQSDEPDLNLLMVDSLIQGLSGGVRTRRPCLEALSFAIYRVPEVLADRSALVIEKFTSFATNPFNSLQILEYLFMVGYTPKLHVGIFQDVDYYRVFGLALMYVEHYIRPDAETITTLDGKESYALAQHVYRISFSIFYTWFLSMKMEDRARFAPFIINGLQEANGKRKKMNSAIEVCLDWLLLNTYGNVDAAPRSWFMYDAVAFPGYGSRPLPSDWKKRQKAQMENVAETKAWKLGNAIMEVSIIKEPIGWARVVVHRPAGKMELYCHVEKVRSSTTFDDFEDFFESLKANTGGKFAQDHQGTTTSTSTKSVDSYEGSIRSLILPLLSSTEPWDASKLREYANVDQLKQTLHILHFMPLIDPHQVGILYVAPGQTREEEILSNTHGSLTYAYFLSNLTQVVDLASVEDHRVVARGLDMKLHGRHTRAWMDDISAINFHVATMMPNIGDNTTKKGPIGNDAVKIIWNDGGQPYDFATFRSSFNLINIVIEPQSPALTSAYKTSLDAYLKVTIQTAPGVPRVTPIGDFKMVRLDYLPVMVRHFSIFAGLFCESWMKTGCDDVEKTGCDDVERTPLETNWKARLACIERSEKYLKPQKA